MDDEVGGGLGLEGRAGGAAAAAHLVVRVVCQLCVGCARVVCGLCAGCDSVCQLCVGCVRVVYVVWAADVEPAGWSVCVCMCRVFGVWCHHRTHSCSYVDAFICSEFS